MEQLWTGFACGFLLPSACSVLYKCAIKWYREKELGKEIILHLRDRRLSVPWNATFLSVNNQGQIFTCHCKKRWERAECLGLLGTWLQGQMSMNSKASDALVTGLYKSLTFLKSAKGPNYSPVRCMSHITEQSSPWMTLLKNWWAAWLGQRDDPDSSTALLSPEGKMSLPSGTCW